MTGKRVCRFRRMMSASSPSHTSHPNLETPSFKGKCIGISIGPNDYPSISRMNREKMTWVALLHIRSRACLGRDSGKITNPITSSRLVKISGISPFLAHSTPQTAASNQQSASVLIPGPFYKGPPEEIPPLSAGSPKRAEIRSGK